MKLKKKAQSHHTKKSTQSNKQSLNKRRFFLSKYIPKNRKAIAMTIIAVAVVVAIAGAIPLPHSFAKDDTISFSTETKEDAGMELGDSKVIQEGRDGRKTVNVEFLQSAWGKLFGIQPIQQKEVASTITDAPIDKIVLNGTSKYQYMLCSDGGYSYYTDEQFKDADTGFTSKSGDDCKEKNKGYKVSLSNSNPSDNGASSVSRPTSTTQPDTYEADKINREVEKLRWCNEQDEKIGNEYIGKVHQAQATQDITNKEFNAIVDPAYFKYSGNIGLLRASGCSITNPYPNFVRQ